MQIALETADRVFSKWGLEMSFKKTKVMAVGCDVVPSHFHLERGSIETVFCFKYLGSYLAKDGGVGLEVTHRIRQRPMLSTSSRHFGRMLTFRRQSD